MPDTLISMEPIRAAVFSGENTLRAFLVELDAHERAALYELLYSFGCRYGGRALDDWRRKRDSLPRFSCH